MKRMRLALVFGLVMALLTLLLYRFVEPVFGASETSEVLDRKTLGWLEDPPMGAANLDTVSPPPRFYVDGIRFGPGTTWFEWAPRGSSSAPNRVLEIVRSDLGSAQLVTIFQDGSMSRQHLAAQTPPADRPVASRRMAFVVPPAGKVHFIGLECAFPGVAKIVLWDSEKYFYGALMRHNGVIAFYLGIVGILILLNAFVYATTRDRLYFDYALFLFFHGASTLAYEGVYAGTALARVPGVHQILMLSIPLSVFAVLRFSERFLELHRPRGVAYWLIRSLSVVYLVLLLQILVLSQPKVWEAVIFVQSSVVLLTGFCLLGVAAFRACTGGWAQLIFLLAFIPHVMAVSGFLAGRLGLTTPDPFFYYKLLLSSILEMTLITLALAIALRDAIRRRHRANAEALEASERARGIEVAFREELEGQVAERTKDLARADRQKSHLLSLLAHDLRSPLNSIVQMTDFTLRRSDAVSDQRSVLSSIFHTSRSLYSLLENLLAWARLNWEGRRPSMEAFGLREALDPALDLYLEPIEQKSIVLEGLETWDCSVFADRTMIRTLLRNLLSNAIRHSPEGGCIRFFGTVKTDSVRLGLANGGDPFPQGVLEGLMEEESDSHAEGRRGHDADDIASGLGLLLCREVIRAHDGRLSFGTFPGLGPLVEFELPRRTL